MLCRKRALSSEVRYWSSDRFSTEDTQLNFGPGPAWSIIVSAEIKHTGSHAAKRLHLDPGRSCAIHASRRELVVNQWLSKLGRARCRDRYVQFLATITE